jgi:SAM-dependent methyltransferase
VLDVGCGAGRFLRLAADRGADVAGLDAAAALVAIARERLPGADLRRARWSSCRGTTAASTPSRASTPSTTRPGPPRPPPKRPASSARRPGRDRHLGRPEECEAAAYLGALGALLPPPPPGAPGPFALSQPGALASLARAAGLQPAAETGVETAWEYPDEETLLRGLLSAGPAARAIAEAGEARVRDAVLAAVAPYRTPGGAYRLRTSSATPSRRTGEAAAIAWADRAGRGTIGA